MEQLNEQIANDLNKRYRATSLTVLAQFLVTVVLTVLAVFLAGKVQPFGVATGDASFSVENLTNPNAAGSTLTTFLWITILALAISVFLLRRAIFAPAALRDTATVKGASGLLASLQTKTILLAAIGLIVAVLGFVIALASGDWLDMLRAAAIAAIIFFVSLPRKAAWQRLAQAAAK